MPTIASELTFGIVWPCKRRLTVSEVMLALSDAIANDKVDAAEAGEQPNVYDAVRLLDHAGVFTFTKD